jgi:hypothetical protein
MCISIHTKKYKNDRLVEAKNINKYRLVFLRLNKPALANFPSAFSNSFRVAIA